MAKNSNMVVYIIIGIIILFFSLNNQELFSIKEQPSNSDLEITYYDSSQNEVNFEPYNYKEATKQKFNLISLLQIFGVVNIPHSTRIVASGISRYGENTDASRSFSYYNGSIDCLGNADGNCLTGSGSLGYCWKGLVRFPTSSLPTDLTSSSQITGVNLEYFVSNAYNPDYTYYFGVIDNLENYPHGDSDSLRGAIFDRIYYIYSQNSYSFSKGFNAASEGSYTGSLFSSQNSNEIFERDSLDVGITTSCTVGSHNNNYINLATNPSIVINYNTQTCNPENCSSLEKTCGAWSDTCGGTVICGNCSSGNSCNSNGQCVQTTYMKLQLTINNNGNVPFYNVHVLNNLLSWENQNTSASGNLYSFPTVNYSLNPGQSFKVNTSLIEINPSWSGNRIKFSSSISANNSYTGLSYNKLISPLFVNF